VYGRGGDAAVVRKEVFLTEDGWQNLEKELAELLSVGRHEVATRIHKASETGRTVDNAEYDEAKNQQAFLEGRIANLSNILSNAVVAPTDDGGGDVRLGLQGRGDLRKPLQAGLHLGRLGRGRSPGRQDISRVSRGQRKADDHQDPLVRPDAEVLVS